MSTTDEPSLDAAYALESPEDNKRLYRDWAATYDQDFAERSGYRFAELVAARFVALGGNGPVLDAGCGTGLVAAELPKGLVVDGADISSEMLDQARAKEIYRGLYQIDMTTDFTIDAAPYEGLLSAGTFTHGHVGPDALGRLLGCLKRGGIGVISTNGIYFAKVGFQAYLDGLVAEGKIRELELIEEDIYAASGNADGDHGTDRGFIVSFTRS